MFWVTLLSGERNHVLNQIWLLQHAALELCVVLGAVRTFQCWSCDACAAVLPWRLCLQLHNEAKLSPQFHCIRNQPFLLQNSTGSAFQFSRHRIQYRQQIQFIICKTPLPCRQKLLILKWPLNTPVYIHLKLLGSSPTLCCTVQSASPLIACMADITENGQQSCSAGSCFQFHGDVLGRLTNYLSRFSFWTAPPPSCWRCWHSFLHCSPVAANRRLFGAPRP